MKTFVTAPLFLYHSHNRTELERPTLKENLHNCAATLLREPQHSDLRLFSVVHIVNNLLK